MRATLLLAAALVIGIAGQSYAKARSPARGSVERSEIMNAIRAGSGAGGVFMVDYLRVADALTGPFSYAEVRTASGEAGNAFEGWALLQRTGSGWHVLWGVAKGGVDGCGRMAVPYTKAISLMRAAEADDDFFSAAFFRRAAEVSAREITDRCPGRVFVNQEGDE